MYYIKEYRSNKNNRMFYEEPIIVELNNEDGWFKFSHEEIYPFIIIKNPYYKSLGDDVNVKRKNIKYVIYISDCDLYESI